MGKRSRLKRDRRLAAPANAKVAPNFPLDSDTHLAYYLVLVTDVLGQRSRLRALKDLPDSPDGMRAAIRVLKDTVGVVMFWRQGFRDFVAAWGKHSPFFEQLPQQAKEAIHRALSCSISLRQFSDSVVLSVCLLDDKCEGCNTLSGVLGALLAACGMHTLSLCGKHPMRGGIDVGLGMPLPEGDIYGPALERAVYLEGEVAGLPRIAVGAELIKYLDSMAARPVASPFGTLAKHLAQASRRLLFTDVDGVVALDFLGEEFHAHDSNFVLGEVLPEAYRFVRTTQLSCHQQKDQKLSERYDMLWTYFRSRAHIWGAAIERLAEELQGEPK